MSTTPYKDELIRIAGLLGLPDDTDLTSLGDTLSAHIQSEVARRLENEQNIRGAVEGDRVRYEAGLREACARLEGLATELTKRRERAGSQQAFADMSDLANVAVEGHLAAKAILSAAP